MTQPTLSIAANYAYSNGMGPNYGTLIADGYGGFLGSTDIGGANSVGSVFAFNPGNSDVNTSLTVLGSLSNAVAADTYGPVVTDAQGNIYGASPLGGLYSQGAIYEYQKSTGQVINLTSFDEGTGTGPISGLIADSHLHWNAVRISEILRHAVLARHPGRAGHHPAVDGCGGQCLCRQRHPTDRIQRHHPSIRHPGQL